MVEQSLIVRILCAIGLFFIVQISLFWSKLENLDDKKLTIEAEIEMLIRKRDGLNMKIWSLEKDIYRMEDTLSRIDLMVRDRMPLAESRKHLPFIYFITPTYRRPTQKADLVRLAQTLAHIPNLFWIIVEDSESISKFITDLLKRYRMKSMQLNARTPEEYQQNSSVADWRVPRGVQQRNAALAWLRKNFGSLRNGVIYFGDDDNTYDWRLFDEIRNVTRVGVWPVGLVGGQLVETCIPTNDSVGVRFNSQWKPHRPFPFDMAAFAVNLSLINEHSDASFTFSVPPGYQESVMLKGLGLKLEDLELKANACKNVYVWHTRTEKMKFRLPEDERRFRIGVFSNSVEADSVV